MSKAVNAPQAPGSKLAIWRKAATGRANIQKMRARPARNGTSSAPSMMRSPGESSPKSPPLSAIMVILRPHHDPAEQRRAKHQHHAGDKPKNAVKPPEILDGERAMFRDQKVDQEQHHGNADQRVEEAVQPRRVLLPVPVLALLAARGICGLGSAARPG